MGWIGETYVVDARIGSLVSSPSLGCDGLSADATIFSHLCRRQLSRFAHEQVLYPPHLLGLHDPSRLSRGQRPKPRNKAEEQMVASWGAPHPMCEVSIEMT